MTSTKFSPLHLEAPRLVADAALGEHLAALARASAPSAASRVRRSGWRVPLAALATIAASGSVAYAGQAALDSRNKVDPQPAAAITAAPTRTAAASADATTQAALAALEHLLPPHGKATGHGHPKTGKAKGHPGKHDAGKHKGKNKKDKKDTTDVSPSSPAPFSHDGLSLWRVPAGSAGVSSP